mmetsp:Transcript_24771/g.68312  ORF Transcript_24771/g.68312 Transcript_24771/m.68312 type:complete len:119 (+) Transcript_24771:440-796(+)
MTGSRIDATSNGTDSSSHPLRLASSETNTPAKSDMMIMSVTATDTKREVEARLDRSEKAAERSQSNSPEMNGIEMAIAERTTPKSRFSKMFRDAHPRSSMSTGSVRGVLVAKYGPREK